MSEIKQHILQMRTKINGFRQEDPIYLEYQRKMKEQTNRVNQLFYQIQHLGDHISDQTERNEVFGALDEALTHLTELSKLTKAECDYYVRQQIPELNDRYGKIFEMFLEDKVDSQALHHALDHYILLQSGQIDEEKVKESAWKKFHTDKSD